jgi:hypothetical protein
MPTNKKTLMRGLRYMFTALPMFGIGPVVVHSSFKNQGHPLFIPIIGLGIITCLTGMWFMFVGLRTIMNALFDGDR